MLEFRSDLGNLFGTRAGFTMFGFDSQAFLMALLLPVHVSLSRPFTLSQTGRYYRSLLSFRIDKPGEELWIPSEVEGILHSQQLQSHSHANAK